jgi:hypothetical protein
LNSTDRRLRTESAMRAGGSSRCRACSLQNVFASSKLFADDTPIPVLDPGRGRTKIGRLWGLDARLGQVLQDLERRHGGRDDFFRSSDVLSIGSIHIPGYVSCWEARGNLCRNDKVVIRVETTFMGQFTDLTGRRFGRLTVLGQSKNRGRRVTWLCQCTCGRRKLLVADYLTCGKARSCGCMRDEMTRKRSTTHGATRARQPTKEYRAWSNIKRRCYNPSEPRYSGCGGRGIEMYSPWIESFSAFLRDLGPAPPDTTMKRLDPDGDFEPGNCVWQPKPRRKVKGRKFKQKR